MSFSLIRGRSLSDICIIQIWHEALEIVSEVHLGSFHPNLGM